MKLTVTDIIRETETAVTVCFKNGSFFKKLKYKAGQFITGHFLIDNVVHKRAYSFSSNPIVDKDIRITVKRVEKGLVSNFVNDKLKIGDSIEVEKPAGSFYVEPIKNSTKTYAFFAGGSGITPIFSIMRLLLEKEPNAKLLLVYANQDYQSIIFREKVEELSKQHGNRVMVEHLLSRNESPDFNCHSGLITDSLIVELFEKHEINFENVFCMICGPFGFMEAVKSILHVNGVKSGNIKVELFKSPEVVLTGKDLISDVEIKYNGDSYQMQVQGNKSILQTALKNNIALPYSCRSGMCSTCKASCISGDIKMTEGHFLDVKEVNDGNILTCISYPLSEKVVISI